MKNIPNVTFAPQAVVPNYPAETYEAIVMTPELQAWAISAVAHYKSLWNQARAVERTVLASSRSERQWTNNGGHRVAHTADQAGKLFALVQMLSDGRIADGWNGWITQGDWKHIIEASASASAITRL